VCDAGNVIRIPVHYYSQKRSILTHCVCYLLPWSRDPSCQRCTKTWVPDGTIPQHSGPNALGTYPRTNEREQPAFAKRQLGEPPTLK